MSCEHEAGEYSWHCPTCLAFIIANLEIELGIEFTKKQHRQIFDKFID